MGRCLLMVRRGYAPARSAALITAERLENFLPVDSRVLGVGFMVVASVGEGAFTAVVASMAVVVDAGNRMYLFVGKRK